MYVLTLSVTDRTCLCPEQDQTYDIWTASGVHAYCGGLWIAACFATVEMAKLMEDIPTSIKFTEIGDCARQVYQEQLWNGVYFDYDNSKSGHHDSIMADMLAGQWYCRVCSLPPIASVAQALSCFRIIYRMNVLEKSHQGEMLFGAVNGMRPTGAVDKSCLQSREVWTGTTYALASAMLLEARCIEMSLCDHVEEHPSAEKEENNVPLLIHQDGSPELIEADLDFRFDETLNIGFGEDKRRPRKKGLLKHICRNSLKPEYQGKNIREQLATAVGRQDAVAELKEMAYQTAKGIHDGGWQRFGYWFATPEGWETNGNYRSLGYMRPLAIWSMQYGTTG